MCPVYKNYHSLSANANILSRNANLEILSRDELNIFKMSYIGLGLWVLPRKCPWRRYQVTWKTLLHKREVAHNSRVHTQLEKQENLYVLLLNKHHDSTDLEDKYQFWIHRFWLYWPIRQLQRHQAWPTLVLVRAGLAENLHEVVILAQPFSGSGFLCLQMLFHEASFNSHFQCTSTGPTPGAYMGTVTHTKSCL